MKASKEVKREAVALVAAIVLVVIAAFLVKTYFYGEKPAVEPVKEAVETAEKEPAGQVPEREIYLKKAEQNKISIEKSVNERTEQVAGAEFSNLKTDINEVSAKTVKPKNPAFRSEIFAVKNADFDEARITLQKTGSVDAIFYCQNFDFDNETCEKWEKTNIPFEQTEDTVTFAVTHFSAYVAGENVSLSVYSYSRPANIQAPFYAEYVNSSNNWQVNDSFANVTINFSDGVFDNMTFNATAQRWEYNRSFTSEDVYNYTVNATSAVYENLNLTDNITIFDCTVPQQNTYINEDAILCPGNFSDMNFIINSSNVTFSCNGATGGSGITFISSGGNSNVTIENCTPGNTFPNILNIVNGENITVRNVKGERRANLANLRNVLIQNLTVITPLFTSPPEVLEISNSQNITINSSSFNQRYYNGHRDSVVISGVSGLVISDTLAAKATSFHRTRSSLEISDSEKILMDGFRATTDPVRAHNLTNVTIRNSQMSNVKVFNATFTNALLENSTIDGINIDGINVTITNNTIHFVENLIYLRSTMNLTNSSIVNNTFKTPHSGSRTYSLQLNNTLIEGNSLEGTGGTLNPMLNLRNSVNSIIINNRIFDNDDGGFYFYASNNNITMDNLTVYDTRAYSALSFFSGNPENSTFNNLHIYDNYRGITSATNVTIENSTIMNNSFRDINIESSDNLQIELRNSRIGQRIYLAGITKIKGVNLTFPNTSSEIMYENITLSGSLNVNNNLTLGNNFINVPSADFPQFNKTAILKFKKLPWTTTPQLFKDGVRCDDTDDCNITSYDDGAGILKARVASFSNYTTGNAQTCYNITDDLYINRNSTICSGSYQVNDTNNDGIIIINASGITITLEGGTFLLKGNNSGIGFFAENKTSITLESFGTGCWEVRNYEEAFHFKNVSNVRLEDIMLRYNDNGIAIYNSTNSSIVAVEPFCTDLNNRKNSVLILGSSGISVASMSAKAANVSFNITDSSGTSLKSTATGPLIIEESNVGLQLTNSENTTIDGRILNNNEGAVFVNSTNIELTNRVWSDQVLNNNITAFSSTGIEIFSSAFLFPFVNSSIKLTDSSAILDTFSMRNQTGIAVNIDNSTANISNVSFENNDISLLVNKTSGVNILSSDFSSTNLSFYLTDSTSINISGISISSSDIPFYLIDSTSISISNISISGSSDYDLFSINSNATVFDFYASNPFFSDASSNISATNFTLSAVNSSINYGSIFIDEAVNTSSGLYLLWNLSGLDPSINPAFNQSATITLYNLLWPVNPFVKKDGVRCDNTSECTIISYDNQNGTLMFNVTGFSNYSSSNPNLPGTPDNDPPTEPDVYDGKDFVDRNWTSSQSVLYGSWNGSQDRSNIFYSYRVVDGNGSCPDGCALKYVGSARQVTVSGLSLAECHTYFFEVRAEDTFYNTANITSSDGITVDVTEPAISSLESPTHPSQNVYYNKNDVEFNWAGAEPDNTCPANASGVAGFSYAFDRSSSTIPDATIDTTSNSTSFSNVQNGEWYFHIRAIDRAGNAGTTSARRVRINATTPRVTIEPVETPTLLANVNISGRVTGNVSDTIAVFRNDDNTQNISIGSTQTAFTFNTGLDLGINEIYVNALLNGTTVDTSNTLYIRRLSEARRNITGFTVSYSGGSLTDTSESNLLVTESADADFGVGKSSNRLFVFVTKPGADTAERESYVVNNTFFDLMNPSIGFPLSIEQRDISTILNYQDLEIVGNQSVQAGRYTLVITNNGTVNGTPQIVVRLI